MPLFDVPGWSVPSAPVSQASKKRKRPMAKDSADDIDEAERMHSAQKNIEKLMKTLGAGMDALEGEDTEQPVKRKREGKEKKVKDVDRGQNLEVERGRKAGMQGKRGEVQQDDGKKQKKRSNTDGTLAAADKPQGHSSPSPAKQKKQKQKQKRVRSVDARSDASSTHDDVPATSVASVSTPQASTKTAGRGKDKNIQDGLTALQAKMKGSLDGARFRYGCSRRCPTLGIIVLPQMDQRNALQVR